LPLIYANRWAYTWGSARAAAAPIIYAFFLTSVLIYTRVAKEVPLDTRTEFYAVLESLEEVIDHEMNPEEHEELRARLNRIQKKGLNTDLEQLATQILEFVNSEAIFVVPHEPNLYDRAIDIFNSFEQKWLSRSRLKLLIIIGAMIFGLSGGLRLIYYSRDQVLLENLLRNRVSDLTTTNNVSLFWAGVQLIMEGLVGLIMIIGTTLLILGKEKIGLEFSSIGLLISLVGVNLVQFYIDQFSTITKSFIQFLILQTIYYYQRRFRIK
jgi:hypothetical protein